MRYVRSTESVLYSWSPIICVKIGRIQEEKNAQTVFHSDVTVCSSTIIRYICDDTVFGGHFQSIWEPIKGRCDYCYEWPSECVRYNDVYVVGTFCWQASHIFDRINRSMHFISDHFSVWIRLFAQRIQFIR